MYQNKSGEAVDLNALTLQDVFFDISNAVMGASGKRKMDVVEARILYGAIYGDHRTRVWNPELFNGQENLFSEICPGHPELAQMVQVYEIDNLYFWLDAISNRGICGVPSKMQRAVAP